MLEAVKLARECVQGTVKAEFLHDRRTQQAVVLNLIIVGEAAARIVGEYEEFADAHPEIPNERHAQPHGSRVF